MGKDDEVVLVPNPSKLIVKVIKKTADGKNEVILVPNPEFDD